MKITVYTIALNEERFVDRWANSTEDADHRLVVDTGSTDATMSRLADYGIAYQQIRISPFRFDDARNAALALLPECDVVVSLDMDEVLVPGWRELLERSWTGNRLQYGYVWSPEVTFWTDKIVGRFSHRWKHPVHETLVARGLEQMGRCDEILIEHHPDATKNRHYIDLLEMAVREDPDDDRSAHYLGREYFMMQRYGEAITALQHHLKMKTALWAAERASSMRYIAQAYALLGEAKAYEWFMRATLEDGSRDSYVAAAKYCLNQANVHACIDLCLRATAVPPTTAYMADRYANNEGPYDLAGIAYLHLGDRKAALSMAGTALRLNPKKLQLA
jgi:glycosyltransferase involved in cell wall biosynthesis